MLNRLYDLADQLGAGLDVNPEAQTARTWLRGEEFSGKYAAVITWLWQRR